MAIGNPRYAHLGEMIWDRLSKEGVLYTFLPRGGEVATQLDTEELRAYFGRFAAYALEHRLRGERALLVFQPGLDFVACFYACLLCGIVAVPIYPPRPNRGMERFSHIMADVKAKAVLTHKPVLDMLRGRNADQEYAWTDSGVFWGLANAQGDLNTGAESSLPSLSDTDLEGLAFSRRPEDIAFIQYTSGSTSDPKGVIISHSNILSNEERIRLYFGHNENTVVFGWLPFHHDMGLIGNILQPFYCGGECILMPPAYFLQNPLRWLANIMTWKATTSGGPNFAYQLCVDEYDPEKCEGLDLSHWDLAFNGAETVRSETMDAFVRCYGPHGFKKSAFYPCYGLAEATLLVSGGVKESIYTELELDSEALGEGRLNVQAIRATGIGAPGDSRGQELMQEHRRELMTPPAKGTPGPGSIAGSANTITVVSSGHCASELTVVCVDPATNIPCAQDQIGEIVLAGSSVSAGYWGRSERLESRIQLEGYPGLEFFKTGDLGFIYDNELFVTGRSKELIIIGGRNIYPQDIEWTILQNTEALQDCAAFSVTGQNSGQEEIVVLAELRRGNISKATLSDPAFEAQLTSQIKARVLSEHDVQLSHLVFLKPYSIPKTSSGKTMRGRCREFYLGGQLEASRKVDKTAHS